MSYTKHTWVSGEAVTKDKLNNIESGIEEAGPNIVLITKSGNVYSSSYTAPEIAALYAAGKEVILEYNKEYYFFASTTYVANATSYQFSFRKIIPSISDGGSYYYIKYWGFTISYSSNTTTVSYNNTGESLNHVPFYSYEISYDSTGSPQWSITYDDITDLYSTAGDNFLRLPILTDTYIVDTGETVDISSEDISETEAARFYYFVNYDGKYEYNSTYEEDFWYITVTYKNIIQINGINTLRIIKVKDVSYYGSGFSDQTITVTDIPIGMPSGGNTGQFLIKNSATNYDASWKTLTVGGTNLLKLTRNGFSGWTTWCSANSVTSWTRTVDGLGNCIRYTKSGGTVPYLVVKCYETYSKLMANVPYTISTKVANYNQSCQFRLWDSADGSTWENERAVGTLPGYADGFHDFSYTFTPSATRYYRVGLLVINLSSDVDMFDTWKLEKGEIVTDWSRAPEDGVKTTKNIINDSQVDVESNDFSIHIIDANTGDTTLDNTGFYSPNIDSPSVTPRYAGPTAITVNANSVASSDGSTFRTLTDALAALSGKWLEKNVTITMSTNTTEGAGATNYVKLAGVFGPGSITIAGNSKSITARINIERTGVPVTISSLTIASSYVPSSQEAIVWCTAVTDVSISSCTINGSGVSNNIDGFTCHSGFSKISSTNIANTRMPIAARGGRIHVDACTGSGYYGLVAVDGGRITYNNTYPSGSGSNTLEARAGTITGTGSPSGGSTPTPPSSTTTVTAASVATKTYQVSNGWLSDVTLRQGVYDNITHYGVISFGTTGWSGKTIVSGTLTIRRLNGGKGSSVTVKMKTTTSTAAAGQANPAGTTTDYGAIGTVNINNTLVCAIPAAALQEIANNTRKSLMLYADGATDYAVFAGSDNSTYKPSLEVVYSN